MAIGFNAEHGKKIDNLNVGLAKTNEQLEQNMKKLSYKERQTNLYSKFYQKLRKGTTTSLACLGDSLTYGLDKTSLDKRPCPSTPNETGYVYNAIDTRASVSYPEQLQTILNEVYGIGKVSVINKGISGDDTSEAYTHWNVNTDLALMSLGTNDAINSPYVGNLDTFLSWYRKLIEKHLDNNCGIIIMTPLKEKIDYDVDISIFRQAIFSLADEYNIPVVKGNEFLQNVNDDNYSDPIHLNGKGYAYLGTRIASLFIGNGIYNKKEIISGNTLSTLEQDNYSLVGSPLQYTSNTDAGSTEGLNNTGVGILLNATNKAIYYSFYTKEENLVLYPICFYAPNSSLKVEIDFSTQNPQPTNDFALLYGDINRINPNSNITIVNGSSGGTISKKDTLMNSPIYITGKGWHTVKITSPVPNVVFQGLNFVSMDTHKTYVSMINNFQNYYNSMVLSNYTNNLPNGDFSNGTTNWARANALFTVANNTMTLTGTGDAMSMGSDNVSNLVAVAGHKIYITSKQLVTDSVCSKIQISAYGSTGGSIGSGISVQSTPIANNQYKLSCIATIPSGVTGNVKVSCQYFYADAPTASGKVMKIQQVMLVDLTALVGVGNEPSLAWCDANLPFKA